MTGSGRPRGRRPRRSAAADSSSASRTAGKRSRPSSTASTRTASCSSWRRPARPSPRRGRPRRPRRWSRHPARTAVPVPRDVTLLCPRAGRDTRGRRGAPAARRDLGRPALDDGPMMQVCRDSAHPVITVLGVRRVDSLDEVERILPDAPSSRPRSGGSTPSRRRGRRRVRDLRRAQCRDGPRRRLHRPRRLTPDRASVALVHRGEPLVVRLEVGVPVTRGLAVEPLRVTGV